jgi:phosphoribosylformylglycinamidine synthase
VIGGNVSLYNESAGADIDPTPVIGLLGVLDELVAAPPGWNWRAGDKIVLVGARHAEGASPFPLAGSRWATGRGRRGGVLGGVDHDSLAATLDFVTNEVASICAGAASDVTAVHDALGGGLATAIAEMVAVTQVGAVLSELEAHGELFSEIPGRFVMATSDLDALWRRAEVAGVPIALLGTCGGEALVIGSMINLSVDDITSRRDGALVDAIEATS